MQNKLRQRTPRFSKSRSSAFVALSRGDLAEEVWVNAWHDAQRRGLARAVETEHLDLCAVVEPKRRLRVAQDHFVAGGDETSHFVHGVDDEGFGGHSGGDFTRYYWLIELSCEMDKTYKENQNLSTRIEFKSNAVSRPLTSSATT